MERRLAAIVSADVVGYSRLMGEDEAGTLKALKALRHDIVNPKAAQYGGRIIKLIGDGALMEFASVVDAVVFSVEVQCAVRERDRGVDGRRRIVFRIGVNIGDVLVEGDDIYGDGVNVAARLEGLAEPGGICLAQSVVDQVKDKLDLTIECLGTRELKNIAEPVTIHRVVLDGRAAALVTPVAAARPRPFRRPWPVLAALAAAVVVAAGGLIWWQSGVPEVAPAATTATPAREASIAVLPFVNISGDTEQDYFADGMTEDLITDLSKISGLSVISRSSTAGYKNKKIDIREVGATLNVQYVIEGSVRKAGERVRINAQLINAGTGAHLWAERYDGTLNDIFSLQDLVLEKIVGSLELKLTSAEKKRLATRGTESVAAHDLYLRGLFHEARFTRPGFAEARRLYEQALSIDPDYAMPYTRISNMLELSARNGWSKDVTADLDLAVQLAEKALRLDPNNPKIYWSLGRALARRQAPDALPRGIGALRQAIELDPDFADAYAYLTVLYVADGRPEDGLRSIETAMRLNPRFPFWYLFMRGMARFYVEDYEAAVADFEAAVERSPTALFLRWWLAASYAQLGRADDAEWQVEELNSMGFEGSIETIVETQPMRNPEFLKIYKEALRKAGIPE